MVPSDALKVIAPAYLSTFKETRMGFQLSALMIQNGTPEIKKIPLISVSFLPIPIYMEYKQTSPRSYSRKLQKFYTNGVMIT